MNTLHIRELDNVQIIADAKTLLLEYGHYMYSELPLTDGRKSFYEQMEQFPGSKYKSPEGYFMVVYSDDKPAACIGLRKFDDNLCEMKRMYVRPAYRGKGIGQLLIDTVVKKAREMGFHKILLDTNAEMSEAVVLYRKNGFKDTYAYCLNENPNVIYLEFLL